MDENMRKAREEVTAYFNGLNAQNRQEWNAVFNDLMNTNLFDLFAVQHVVQQEIERREVISKLREYSFEELQQAKQDSEVMKAVIKQHRMEFARLPMQRLRISHDKGCILLNLENIRTKSIRTYDAFHIERDEMKEETCETNPEELVMDGGVDFLAYLKPEWVKERRKVTIKNIVFFYEIFLTTFNNATHVQLDSFVPMKLEFILSTLPNLVQLKCRGEVTNCSDSDLNNLTARAINFESLEVNLDQLSTVTSAGIANMIQNINCVDGARIDIRNYYESKFATYHRVFDSPLILSANVVNGYCEFSRADGKTIRLFINGEEIDD